MHKSASDEARQYLLDFLLDEFRSFPQTRIRLLPLSKHDGVAVKTEAREYFFPTVWIKTLNWGEINGLVSKIKSVLE